MGPSRDPRRPQDSGSSGLGVGDVTFGVGVHTPHHPVHLMALYAMVLVMVYTMVCNGMHTVGHKGSPYGIRIHMVCVCLRNGDGVHPHTVSIAPRDGLHHVVPHVGGGQI